MDINKNLDGIGVSATRDFPTEEVTSSFIGDVMTTEEKVDFVTGSSYKGSWDALGMTGVGRYVMPNGTVYEGEMWDGMFHGHGSLYWSKNQRLDVIHHRGKLQDHKYTFSDGLSYQDKDWSYCKFPDRRFYESMNKGLRPGGRSLRSAKQPTKILPAGCYDAGDGVFDPKTLCVTSYDDSNKILRTPTQDECFWIIENCRKSWTEPTGYRTSLNENWSDDLSELPYSLAMSKDSPDLWWKRLTTFKRDLSNFDQENEASKDNGYLDMPELCLCGQYVILGEPCHCPPVCVTSEIEWQDDLVEKRFYSEQSSQCHENAEMESNDTLFNPYRGSFIDYSSEYALGGRTIEGTEAFDYNVSGINVSEEIRQSVSLEKFFEANGTLEKKVQDEVDDQQLLSADARSKSELVNEQTKNKKNLKTDAEEKLGVIAKPINTVEDEILSRSSKIDHDEKIEKPQKFKENYIPQKSIDENQGSIESSGVFMKKEKIGQSFNGANQVIIGGQEIGARQEEITNKVIEKLENKNVTSKYSVEYLLKSNGDIEKKVNLQPEIQVKNVQPAEIDKNVNSQSQNIDNNKFQVQDVQQKSTERLHENEISRSDNIATDKILSDDVLQKSTEENHKNMNSKPENMEKINVLPKSNEEIGKIRISQPKIIAENTDEREAETQHHEEKRSLERTMKKSALPNSSDEIHEHYAGDSQNIEENDVENSTDKKNNVSASSRETSLENYDYVTDATIPREKVSEATNPETSKDRRTELKLLLKATKTGSIDEIQQNSQIHRLENDGPSGSSSKLRENTKFSATKTATAVIVDEELAEKKLENDDRIVAETSVKLHGNGKPSATETPTVVIVDEKVTEKKLENDDQIVAATSVDIFADELIKYEVEDHAQDDKGANDKVDRKNTVHLIGNEITEKVIIQKYVADFEENKSPKKAFEFKFSEENEEIFEGESTTSETYRSKKSSNDWKILEQPSQGLATEETKVVKTKTIETSGRKFSEEILQKSESKSGLKIPSYNVKTAEKSFDFLKTERISLEKMHSSPTSLPSKKEKNCEHEEIIEIYKKVSKKKKQKKKCSNAIVWRLSSTLNEYSTQAKMPCHSCGLRQITNTENVRSGAALTVPRSRPVEYGRKPCNSQIHKPTTQEVPVIALPCCKEYPFKIQAKPDRFTDNQSCNIRHKK